MAYVSKFTGEEQVKIVKKWRKQDPEERDNYLVPLGICEATVRAWAKKHGMTRKYRTNGDNGKRLKAVDTSQRDSVMNLTMENRDLRKENKRLKLAVAELYLKGNSNGKQTQSGD